MTGNLKKKTIKAKRDGSFVLECCKCMDYDGRPRYLESYVYLWAHWVILGLIDGFRVIDFEFNDQFVTGIF